MFKFSNELRDKIVRNTIITVGTVSSALTFFPNTYFLDKYTHYFQFFRNGFPVEVPEDCQTLLEEVAEELSLTIRKPTVDLFSTIGFDVLRFGSAWSQGGCRIGIPNNFTYKSKNDVDRSILIDGKPVPWDSEDGQNLKESLILSRLAKKYAIARELHIAHGPILFLHGSYPIIVVMCIAYINNFVYNKANWHLRPAYLMRAFYALLTVFSFGLYFMLKDTTTQYYELCADSYLAKVSEEYALGGKEFCEKILQRHRVFRNLFSRGSSYFSADGDELHLIRNKHLLLKYRLRIFREALNNIHENSVVGSLDIQ